MIIACVAEQVTELLWKLVMFWSMRFVAAEKGMEFLWNFETTVVHSVAAVNASPWKWKLLLD